MWKLVSPPLVGGDKGEGETRTLRDIDLFPPPPLPSPIKGEGFLGSRGITRPELLEMSRPGDLERKKRHQRPMNPSWLQVKASIRRGVWIFWLRNKRDMLF